MADIKRARTLLARGDQEAATQELVDVLHSDGRNVEAWLLLADLVEDSSERKDCYTEVLKIDPNNQQARLQIALLGGKPGLKFGRSDPRRPEKAPEEPPQEQPEAIPLPPPKAQFEPQAPRDSSIAPEMLLRSELAQGPLPEEEPEEIEQPPAARSLTVDTIKETLNTYPAMVAPVVKKSAKKIYHNRLFQVLVALAAVAVVLFLFLTYFSKVVPAQAPANLIVGPSKKYIPAVVMLPNGFQLQRASDSAVISLPNAEGYRITYTNPGFANQEREVNVSYEVLLYNSPVDAEVALQDAANPDTYKSAGKTVEQASFSPTQLARVDSSALMFGQDQASTGGASQVSYILVLRQANLIAKVTAIAPVDSVQSNLAQSLRNKLYQSVFYYASLLTRLMPLAPANQVTVNQPTFLPPVVAQPTPTLSATAAPPDNVLLRDRFDEPAASQQNWKIVSGAWTFDNGRLVCQAPSYDCQAFAGDLKWKDYTFTVDVEGIEGLDRLLYFGVAQGQKQYMIRFSADPVNEVVLVEQVAGRPDREVKKVTFKNYNRMVYRLSVTTRDKSLKVTIDSFPVIEVDALPVDLSGQVGLGLLQSTVKDAPPATVRFDNVDVSIEKK